MTEDLFSEFPPTSAEQWMAQIVRDLKGKDPQSLYWSPDGDLKCNPFVHADDISESPPPLARFGKWQIGEGFRVTDAGESNRQILDALGGGVESLWITCPGDIAWERLFDHVELPLIRIILEFEGDRQRGFESFMAYAGTHTVPGKSGISVVGPHFDAPEHIRFCTKAGELDTISGGLAALLIRAIEDSLWNPGLLEKRDVYLHTGNQYLVEIARLRACRILWQNLAEALEFRVTPDFAISASTIRQAGEDPYEHMIRSAFGCTATVLGGADQVYVSPASGGDRSERFYHHVARNVSHLLRYESKFTEIPDPVAGAYYLDKVTMDIVERTWEILKAESVRQRI